MFKTVAFDSLAAGPRLVVTGGIHGNEYCGPAAINRLMQAVDSGEVVLKKGVLECAPICNPEACRQGVRFVERNLNRHLFPKEEKRFYEDSIDPALCALLDRADALLDLHSYASEGGPFIFLSGTNPEEKRFARALGVRDFVTGWSEAYGVAGKKGDREGQGTTEYARLGGAVAVTLECGHHHNADAADVGYAAALRALDYLGMLREDCPAKRALPQKPETKEQRVVRMKTVFYRQEGTAWTRDFRHFDEVRAEEVLATLPDGKTIAAPEDGFVILPKKDAAFGEEWFYFGAKTDFA
ncbi:MAG: succinylglutamate desuccinylase/aspartoacylase family protein [Rickettsiales bacterium]